MNRWIPALCLLVVLLALHLPAQACTCGGVMWNPPTWWLENSDYVAMGEVVDVYDNPEGYDVQALFRVHAVWKGEVHALEVLVTDRSTCGVFFVVGEDYLVYLDENTSGELYAHACRRIQQGEWIAADIEEIGPPMIVAAEESSFGMVKARFESR